MSRTRAVLLAALSLAIVPAAVGCSSDESANVEEGDEQALTEAKVLSKGISYPSGLAVAGGHVYFGANRFVASGDPELDQQFAYWEGKFSRVSLTGGRPQTVVEIGPINRVRASGNKIFYAMGDGCWISSVDAGGASPARDTQVYNDSNCDGEGPGTISGFEVTNDKLIVVRTDGEVKIGSLTGANMKKLGEVKIGNWGDLVEAHALADGNIYILTRTYLTDAQNRQLPQALYKISIANGAVSKVLDVTGSPWKNLTSDGKNLYFTQNDTKVAVLPAGATAPKQIAEGLGAIIDLASDGKSVFVADSKRGAIYQIADALTAAPKRQKKLAVAKGVQSLVVAEGALFFGSHDIEGRKAAGVIASIPLAP